MKNNKGYTLVELLVTLAVFAIIMAEIGSMMMNSSKLYRNGTYEVELQTEAQQIVQQMEELLVDVTCSVSVDYQVSLSSDFITISNNSHGLAGDGDSTVYYITVDKDPDLGYGTMYFSKTSSVPGETPVSNIPMAEYVQSISLNMESYTSDVVTLNVSMNNGRYGYQASQDIYLRNGVGSGGGGSYNNSAAYDVELVVLRYKEYDLDSVIVGRPGETFTYEWDAAMDSSKLSAAQNQYVLSGDTLKLSHTMNRKQNWYRENVGPYTVIARGDQGSVLRISVRTDKVGYGSDDHAVYYQNVASSFATMSPVPVYGIDVTEADHIDVEMVYDNGTDTQEVLIWRDDNPVPGMNAGTNGDGHPLIQNVGATYYFVSEGPGARIEMSFQQLYFDKNGNDNTIEVTSSLLQDNQIIAHNANGLPGYYEYIRVSGKTVSFQVTLDYGGDEMEFKIHMMPVPCSGYPPMDANSVPDEVAERFWTAVGF